MLSFYRYAVMLTVTKTKQILVQLIVNEVVVGYSLSSSSRCLQRCCRRRQRREIRRIRNRNDNDNDGDEESEPANEYIIRPFLISEDEDKESVVAIRHLLEQEQEQDTRNEWNGMVGLVMNSHRICVI